MWVEGNGDVPKIGGNTASENWGVKEEIPLRRRDGE